MDQNMRRYFAIALSIFIHAALLVLVARFTMDLTSPEGTVVDGSVEIDIMPQGSQTSTVNVAPVAVPSENPTPVNEPPPAATATVLPQKTVPAQDTQATSPTASAVAVQQSETPTASEPIEEVTPPVVTESQDAATLPTQEDEEPAVATGVAPNPDTQTNPESVGQTDTAAAATPATPVAGENAGEGSVANQNYGVPSGATDARTLAAMPGNRRPEYPLMARFRRIQGRTVAQFTVSGDGTVSSPRIYSSENETFNKPVLDAIRAWKFKGPVQPGEYFWTFDFRLSGQEKESGGQLRR